MVLPQTLCRFSFLLANMLKWQAYGQFRVKPIFFGRVLRRVLSVAVCRLSMTPYVMVAANSNLSPTFLDRGGKPPLYHGRRDSSR